MAWEEMNDQITRLMERVRELEDEVKNLRVVNDDLREGWDKCLEKLRILEKKEF